MSDLSPFVESLCEVAYQEARRKKPKNRPVEVKDLIAPLFTAWVNFRDNALAFWMDSTAANVPAEKLLALYDGVDDLLFKQGIYLWEDPYDDEETVHFIAWGIAVLRWSYKAEAGRGVGWLEYTAEMLQDWLDENHPQYQQGRLL